MSLRAKSLERHIGRTTFEEIPHWRVGRKTWIEYRQAAGRKGYVPLLTDPGHQPKTAKNDIPTYLLHLAPAGVSGWQVCPWASPGCRAACLNTAGRGAMHSVQAGRILKTQFFADYPLAFLSNLYHEIDLAISRHGEHPTERWAFGPKHNVAFRLNGTSDIRWELVAPWLFYIFPGVTFYDYTKAISRETPENYSLTYSASERDADDAIAARAHVFGRSTVVFDTTKGEALPCTFAGLDVIDGDLTDWRLEPGPVIIGLRAKGDAIGDTSGFVRPA